MMSNESSFQRALRIGRNAADLGFDWELPRHALEKVEEEVQELAEVLDSQELALEELGDLLFAVVNVARKLEIDPGEALERTCAKFDSRFAHVMRRAAETGVDSQKLPLATLEDFWQEAKIREVEAGKPTT